MTCPPTRMGSHIAGRDGEVQGSGLTVPVPACPLVPEQQHEEDYPEPDRAESHDNQHREQVGYAIAAG